MGDQSGIYSESKAVWWWAREGQWPSYPKMVHWVLSDLCDMDCNFCTYRVSGNPSNEMFSAGSELSAYGHDNPVRFIDTARALALVDEFQSAGVLALQFTGGGEPVQHPDHEQIFEKAIGLGLRCALVSNGFKWSDRLLAVLPKFDWVRVSIDAGCAKTYSRIRRVAPGTFDIVLANIRRLADSLGDYPTKLGVGFTVTPDNWREIADGCRLAKDAGASNIRLSAMFGPENEKPFLPVYDEITEIIRQAKAECNGDGFVVQDNFGSRFSDLVQHEPDYPVCPYQYYVTYVGGNCHLYRCCVLSYSRRGMIASGDLSSQRFDEYWASDARKKDFQDFDPRGCPRCMFNEKNRKLLYVAGSTYSGPAEHVEWV